MSSSPLQVEAPLEKLLRLREVRSELQRRRQEAARRRWATPGQMAADLEPGTRQTPALDLIDAAIVKVFHGEVRKQQLAAPPQTGKSQRVSRWTPLWMLTCDPKLRITIVSAEKELAVRWGRQIKRDLEAHPEIGLTLRQDSQAAGRWETDQGGGLFCTGIAAGTVGRPIDVLIIDDPIKDRAQAESKTMRDRAWEFWENDAGTRARKTIIMATRWHTDDLSGRLLQREPGKWESLSIPAIAGDDDPLGRAPGVELESANPDLHPAGYYLEKQATTSPYVWSSLFQQRPTAAEGGLFKRADWRYWTGGHKAADGTRWLHLVDEELGRDERYDLADCAKFITIDLATSTRTSADYTVAGAWAITPSGDLVLLGRARARVPEIDHAEFVAPLRHEWLGRYDVVHIEAASFGTTLIYALSQAGVPVAKLDADADKFTRAQAYAGLVRQHKVWLPRTAEWLDEWLDEHADFKPKAAHDDQVDVGAYAARVAIAHWLPPEDDRVLDQRRVQAITEAPSQEVDLMAAVW